MCPASSSHARHHHRYHIVFSTKYRSPILTGRVRDRVGESIVQTCDELGVRIIRSVLSTDHAHLYLDIPPRLAISEVVQRLKGRASREARRDFPELAQRDRFPGFWSRGFYSASSGYVTEAVVERYLEHHVERDPSSSALLVKQQ